MAEARADRRLAAILAGDVVGYSRLMSADEEGTLRRLNELLKKLIDPKIAECRGRLVKTTGDGLLVEFLSAVDAVRCAVDIQRAVVEQNVGAPVDSRIELRIGVNVGDIIIQDNDIYGDGVNVAARLESMAEPGGICISARVHEDVAGRLDVGFSDMGECDLKNIMRPIRLFRVLLDPTKASIASYTGSASGKPLPIFGDRPSLAVLPFVNMSGDTSQEYFADGISEDLITSISQWCRFPVIARNSSFIYKGRSIDIKQVGQELGARYVLEGSVRKSGHRVRITAQLVDATSGHEIWSERYDRDIGDIFSIQDDITASIAAAVEPELHEMEELRAIRAVKPNLAAYDLVQRGNWHHNRFTPADAEEAQRYYAAAMEIDPRYAPAYASMAYTKYWAAQMRWVSDTQATLQSAYEFAQKAVALDEKDARAHMYLGQVSLWLHRHDDAIAETHRSLELNPSLAQAYSVLAYALDCDGKFEKALETGGYSLRLRPNDRTLARCLPALSLAQYQLGAYETAEAIARRAVAINPIYWIGHQMLAASLGQLGRHDDATQELADIRQREPTISRSEYSRRLPFRDLAHADRIEDGLIKAGWEE